jgi:hypothetical protein
MKVLPFAIKYLAEGPSLLHHKGLLEDHYNSGENRVEISNG